MNTNHVQYINVLITSIQQEKRFKFFLINYNKIIWAEDT